LPRARRGPPERLGKAIVFALCLVPLALVAWDLVQGNFSEPIEEMERATGRWALRLVAVTLAVTPLRWLTGWGWLARYRRMVGLFAFFYATVHLCIYAVLDMELDVADLVEDVVEHPYVTVGFATWLLLVPLAATSTKGWIRRLGGRRWNRLHRLTYAVAVGGTVHYLWAVKKDTLWPLTYALVFALLLGWRAWRRYVAGRPGPASGRSEGVASA
jgi:sulfoxide reductase heme-binding subunit YedZ